MWRILLRNAASNWLGYAVSVIVPLFLTPVILHGLGDTRYAVWVLVFGLTGYYGLLDFGIRAGIVQYMTRHLASGDFGELNRATSTAFLALFSSGIAIALIAIALSCVAPLIYEIPPDVAWEARWAIVVVGLTVAVQLGYSHISAVLIATQRYDLANVVGVAMQIVKALAMYLAIKSGHGLVTLSVIHAGSEWSGYLIKQRMARRILPELRISFRLANRSSFWNVTTFGIWSILNRSADQLRFYGAGFIIGIFMPIAAVAPYALAADFLTKLLGGFKPIATVFYPAMTRWDEQGDWDTLRRVYVAGSRLLLLSSVIVGLIGAAWVGDFFKIWLGREFVDNARYGSLADLFHVLLFGAVFTSGQRIGYQVFWGTRRINYLSGLLCCEAAVNLILTIFLIRPYGLYGVAVASLIPALAFHGILHPLVVCRVIGLPYGQYVKRTLWPTLMAGAAMAGILLALRHTMPTPTTWAGLLTCCTFASVLGLALIFYFGLDASERQRTLSRLFCEVKKTVSFFRRNEMSDKPEVVN